MPIHRLFAVGAAALILSGCAISPQLKRVAVDHNQMVADAENELTLLNIVRASERFPLHFTAVTEVNGGASISAGASLDAALVPGPNSHATGVSANVSTNPSFRAAVLATENFQRGVQKPLSSELVAYYLDEGWRDELIMALFIERVDVLDTANDNALVKSIENFPEGDSEFAGLLCKFHLSVASTAQARPLARVEQLLDREMLESGKHGQDSSGPGDRINTVSASQRRAEIKDFVGLIQNDALSVNGDALYLKSPPASIRISPLPQSRCGNRTVANLSILPRGEPPGRYRLIPRFRSTLGIIYFLGEYIRTEQNSGDARPYRLPHCTKGCDALDGNSEFSYSPLIDIRTGSGDALVDAKFRGRRFYISADEIEANGNAASSLARGMQIIAIVQQLLNLNKSASDLPNSISVSGIN